jgi:hypothetical protein
MFCRVMLTFLPIIFASGCGRVPTTYAAHCSTPLAQWGRESDGFGHMRDVQPVYLASDGSILWNKAIITDNTLRLYMSRMSKMRPEPQVVLDVSPTAKCDRVEAVRTIMNAASMCAGPHSLCSEGGNWRQWPEDAGA